MLEKLLLTLDKRRRRPSEPDLVHPFLEGNYAPVGRESDFTGLQPSRGRIPDALRGTLYRMSPAPRFPPLHRRLYHWFDGDGMIDAFTFSEGRVHHRNRWVRTEKLALEERAGHALFGGIRDLALSPFEGFLALGFTPLDILSLPLRKALGQPLPEEQLLRILRAVARANTSIQLVAGRLLALQEGSVPYEIDPQTLATKGPFDFGGHLDRKHGGSVAHPKRDARTGDHYTFGYWLDHGGFTYYVFDRSGALKQRREITAPYPAMMHDFSITETRAIFYHLPAALYMGDPQGNSVRWEPSRGSRLCIFSRDREGDSPRWYELPPCFIYHQLNAFDDGGAVVLDVVKYPRLPLFDGGGENPNAPGSEYAPGKLVRLRLDLATSELREEFLCELTCEFPMIDLRYAGRRHRHGWLAAHCEPSRGRGLHNTLLHIDLETREIRRRVLGPQSYTGEPLFIPRADSGKDQAEPGEGDGYLLVAVYHEDSQSSELLLLDALRIDAEPIAVVPLPQRVPFGFHGTFVPA